MSNWIFDELSENDELELQGPLGNSYYIPGEKDTPLLLIGTGTGLSPLLGIARDGLASGHSGPIYLYHGSHHPHGLYLQNTLYELAERHQNFHPVFCVSGNKVPVGFRAGRANDIALDDQPNLEGWRIHLCGHPEMAEATRQASLAAGADALKIHSDPFWELAHGKGVSVADKEAINPAQSAERRKYPDPDLELWESLEEGRLLSKVLTEFYNRAYEDPLLSPFFEGVTKQRLIEKQYNFMCQVLTGEDVYFGERPRNAHHWMVISDELLDHREELMESCLRHFKVPEALIRRLRAIEEIYREDIVKDKPWKKILFGKEVPVEGFGEIVMDDATLCDSCQQEIHAGQNVQYHVRLGKVYCETCRQGCND